LFSSHGTMQDNGPPPIFETVAEMQSYGFKPRYSGKDKLDLTLLNNEEHMLLKNLRIAMMFYLNSTCAVYSALYMREQKSRPCIEGLTWRIMRDLVACGSFATMKSAQSELIAYSNEVDYDQIPILNREKPAFHDVLQVFIQRAILTARLKLRYGFTRTEPNPALNLYNFATATVGLAEKQIANTAKQYGWGR